MFAGGPSILRPITTADSYSITSFVFIHIRSRPVTLPSDPWTVAIQGDFRGSRGVNRDRTRDWPGKPEATEFA